jgi:hypothetical protein
VDGIVFAAHGCQGIGLHGFDTVLAAEGEEIEPDGQGSLGVNHLVGDDIGGFAGSACGIVGLGADFVVIGLIDVDAKDSFHFGFPFSTRTPALTVSA